MDAKVVESRTCTPALRQPSAARRKQRCLTAFQGSLRYANMKYEEKKQVDERHTRVS